MEEIVKELHRTNYANLAQTKTLNKKMSSPNLFLLAANDPLKLSQVLRESPLNASSQDEHGYSLLHAAASYDHLELLRNLVKEFHVNVNLKDEDGETALFVVETLKCARLLVEELQADITIRNGEGKTASEKIEEEAESPQVAMYLRKKELENQSTEISDQINSLIPPPPEGILINFSTMLPDDAGEVVDLEFQRRIEELASHSDFTGEDGQRALKDLVTDALRNEQGERSVRQRTS